MSDFQLKNSKYPVQKLPVLWLMVGVGVIVIHLVIAWSLLKLPMPVIMSLRPEAMDDSIKSSQPTPIEIEFITVSQDSQPLIEARPNNTNSSNLVNGESANTKNNQPTVMGSQQQLPSVLSSSSVRNHHTQSASTAGQINPIKSSVSKSSNNNSLSKSTINPSSNPSTSLKQNQIHTNSESVETPTPSKSLSIKNHPIDPIKSDDNKASLNSKSNVTYENKGQANTNNGHFEHNSIVKSSSVGESRTTAQPNPDTKTAVSKAESTKPPVLNKSAANSPTNEVFTGIRADAKWRREPNLEEFERQLWDARQDNQVNIAVSIHINAKGKPTQVDINTNAISIPLQRTLTNAIKRTELEPFVRDGQATSGVVKVTLKFNR